MEAGGVVALLFGLAALAGLLYYFISNYEDPPLWWPNFARPEWDKDPENFSNLETIANAKEGENDETDTFTGVAVAGGDKYAS
ncbi:hypothetical protein TrRE_jg3549 [Triparma retinervis]|uniref:Uncharacterized protein n=1 Tax=Triparma retinervis TaxID=2557542 RepID=A0A9W6ZY58_9STRA|nr:hypothetical protein TrRE_jg3549 [Triparma retinervis]